MSVFLQGYNHLLRELFEDAGFQKTLKVQTDLPEVAAVSETNHLMSLAKCTEVCIFY